MGLADATMRGKCVPEVDCLGPPKTLPLTSWESRWRAREKNSTANSQSSFSKH